MQVRASLDPPQQAGRSLQGDTSARSFQARRRTTKSHDCAPKPVAEAIPNVHSDQRQVRKWRPDYFDPEEGACVCPAISKNLHYVRNTAKQVDMPSVCGNAGGDAAERDLGPVQTSAVGVGIFAGGGTVAP